MRFANIIMLVCVMGLYGFVEAQSIISYGAVLQDLTSVTYLEGDKSRVVVETISQVTNARDLLSPRIQNNVKSIIRYYDISPINNSGLDSTFVFHCLDAQLNGETEYELVLFRNPGSSWAEQGGRGVGFNKTNTLSGMDAFSFWTASISVAEFPIILMEYFTSYNRDQNTINWSTASEFNASHFEILISSNAVTWKAIDAVNAHGNSNALKDYSYDVKDGAIGRHPSGTSIVDVQEEEPLHRNKMSYSMRANHQKRVLN